MTTEETKSTGRAWLRRTAAVVAIALLAWAIGWLAVSAMPGATERGNDLFYDTYYRSRPVTDMENAEVVLVVVDQLSLDEMDKRFKYGWPWPRKFWGMIVQYLDNAGAKTVAFDILFTETSAYEKIIKEEEGDGDDVLFAAGVNQAKSPVVFGSIVTADGNWGRFAPPVTRPTFGAVNVGNDKIYRRYQPQVFGKKSLAVQAVEASGGKPRLDVHNPFALHYYGPYTTKSGKKTFRYISAYKILAAAVEGEQAEKSLGISRDMFRGKIVLLGAITAGTFDLKSSPLSDEYPGPEVQATAMENLLRGDRVVTVTALWLWLLPLLFALGVSGGVIVPRRVTVKVLSPVLALAALIGLGLWLFQGKAITWLPPLQSLVTIALVTLGAFAWTYFSEDRQRRFMLKALSKVVSPAVADQLAREPHRLALGTKHAELTILFTDLADFTSISEGMNVDKIGQMLNLYLGDLSDRVLATDGTLDKYIGDAIMCFWNAPLTQADHAVRACRAALAMVARERELQDAFKALGAPRVFTRIGINTSPVAVGFVGSAHLFNYTVLGDGVNLASRLEGANKLYGTQILITENTAKLVKDCFYVRKIDVLRVKGKREPMAVYELMGEKENAPDTCGRLAAHYEQAFAAYQQKRWDESEKLCLEVFETFGEDGPSKALAKRIGVYRQTPPADPWDGVYEAKEK
jgi:adenylate cyclase